MAKATFDARKEADALRTELLAVRESRRESLEKRLFGLLGTPTPTELMVMRDSRDHAASLENAEDAQLKLKLANQAGDTFPSKAIAQAAATKGWSDIVNTYAATAPLGTRSALEELADIHSGRMTTSRTPQPSQSMHQARSALQPLPFSKPSRAAWPDVTGPQGVCGTKSRAQGLLLPLQQRPVHTGIQGQGDVTRRHRPAPRRITRFWLTGTANPLGVGSRKRGPDSRHCSVLKGGGGIPPSSHHTRHGRH